MWGWIGKLQLKNNFFVIKGGNTMSITSTCSLCGMKHSEGHSIDRTYKSEGGLTPIHIVRDYLSGWIGGCEVALYATDEEIIVISDLKNEIVKMKNDLKYKEKIVKNILDFIRERPKNEKFSTNKENK